MHMNTRSHTAKPLTNILHRLMQFQLTFYKFMGRITDHRGKRETLDFLTPQEGSVLTPPSTYPLFTSLVGALSPSVVRFWADWTQLAHLVGRFSPSLLLNPLFLTASVLLHVLPLNQ